MRIRTALTALGLVCAAAAIAPPAHASGLYFSDRGVRPLGRGGAFVAGADDLGAVWYNPAGIIDADTSVLVDASWLHFSSDFTRRSQVVDSSGVVRVYQFPGTQGTSPILPIPTVVGGVALGPHKEIEVALGLLAPYAAITSYPANAPSRYSLISLDGSALAVPGAWVAYKPIEQIRIGAGVEFLTGTFSSSKVLQATPDDRLLSSPEDPTYDATSQLNVGPIFAPSGNAGVVVAPEKHVRIGMSYQLPFLIDAPAQVTVRLPNAAIFDNAHQQGSDAHVSFELPPIFRMGVEVRPIDPLRIEATFVREFWTVHHDITIHPDNVTLVGVTGLPSPFHVSTIVVPRNFDNANSYRLGAEYSFKIADYVLDARLGFNYDQSAIPNAYLSPLTIDLNKYTVAIGGGLHIGPHWRLDAVYAHIFAIDTTVSPAEAAIPRTNPVQGNPVPTEAINGGDYSARADVLGVGVAYKF